MNSTIFASRVTILFKNGMKRVYTHITALEVITHKDDKFKELYLEGETDDIDGTRIRLKENIPLVGIHTTIIDWYIPAE